MKNSNKVEDGSRPWYPLSREIFIVIAFLIRGFLIRHLKYQIRRQSCNHCSREESEIPSRQMEAAGRLRIDSVKLSSKLMHQTRGGRKP